MERSVIRERTGIFRNFVVCPRIALRSIQATVLVRLVILQQTFEKF